MTSLLHNALSLYLEYQPFIKLGESLHILVPFLIPFSYKPYARVPTFLYGACAQERLFWPIDFPLSPSPTLLPHVFPTPRIRFHNIMPRGLTQFDRVACFGVRVQCSRPPAVSVPF